MNENKRMLAKDTSIDKIFTQIDDHIDQYSARNGNLSNAKKSAVDKSLILPSLSKRPKVFDSTNSVDLKHSHLKDRSLNRVRKLTTNNHTKKIKINSLKGSPADHRVSKRSISRKMEKILYKGYNNASIQNDSRREGTKITLMNQNHSRLRDHLRKLAKLGKKNSNK